MFGVTAYSMLVPSGFLFSHFDFQMALVGMFGIRNFVWVVGKIVVGKFHKIALVGILFFLCRKIRPSIKIEVIEIINMIIIRWIRNYDYELLIAVNNNSWL